MPEVADEWKGSYRVETLNLSPGAGEFIEGMGLYFEAYGIPRIGGRILGLLMLAERPLTLDDMAGALGVSRASVSTNARLSVSGGLVERVGLPGDRRDFYVFSPRAWERSLEVGLTSIQTLRRLAKRGVAALAGQDATGQAHLRTTIEFCDFAEAETRAEIQRWRCRQEQRGGESSAVGTPPAGRNDDDRTDRG